MTTDDEEFADRAGRIVVARMKHYGYTDEQIAQAEQPLDHEASGCYRDWDLVCEDEDGKPNHPLHDAMDEVAEFVVWVLEQDDATRSRPATEPSEGEVEAAVEALRPIVPNSDGVLWMYDHEDGQQEPVTLTYAARAALRAAREVS